ncbi:MAG TPA: lactonase family protein [Candidatus Sulfotelmatobacter sp.]|nr:lactonase family protein [Candidatus Sulfotelmatobacter sp.]
MAATCFFLFLDIPSARAADGKYLFYVGTYTNDNGKSTSSKGIYAYHFDPATGQVTSLGLAAETTNPSFVAPHPSGRYLYAVNEIGNYNGPNSGGVSAFSIDQATGKLTFLNEVPSRGADPCYITVDRTGKYVLVANYTGGSVAVFPILPGGKLGEASAFIQHTGHGANPQRQEGPHAHSIDLSPDNRFAFVDDLGLDELLTYKFDSAKGTLTPTDPPFAKLDAGSGPRHFALLPNGKFAYVVSEIKGTVTAFAHDANAGTFRPMQTLTTLPKDFKGEIEDAEIEIHPSGKFLYASNRGDDNEIAIYKIDQDNGTLTPVGHVPTGGKTPRNFEIDPSGKFLFAENANSDNIVIFRIDQATGKLTATGEKVDVPSPVCIRFLMKK